MLQMDITRTPTFSKAALPLGCGCDVKTEPEGQGMYALALWFYFLKAQSNVIFSRNDAIRLVLWAILSYNLTK